MALLKRFSASPIEEGISLLSILLSSLILPLSYLVPKRRGLWVFFPTHDRATSGGNLWALYDHLAKDRSEIDCRWVTDSPEIHRELVAAGARASRFRVFPVWLALRAEIILIDSINWKLTFGRLRLIQLWHGVGYKNVGLRNERRDWIERIFLRRHCSKYALAVASSDADAQFMRDCFAAERVVIAGTPRNDRLTRVRGAPPTPAPRRTGGLRILYAPTYREQPDGPEPFSADFWPRLDAWLSASDSRFFVKRHPRDSTLQIPGALENIKDVTFESGDVQAMLGASDVLVTDYSSIATDFTLLERPIIFFFYDYEHYLRHSRSFYYDLGKVLPGPVASDQNQLFGLIENLAWFEDPEYRAKYAEFRRNFHAFSDGRACERVIAAIRQLLASGD